MKSYSNNIPLVIQKYKYRSCNFCYVEDVIFVDIKILESKKPVCKLFLKRMKLMESGTEKANVVVVVVAAAAVVVVEIAVTVRRKYSHKVFHVKIALLFANVAGLLQN